MKHIEEEDLIAYQIGEPVDAAAIREHLEHCAECAGMAESIAETLRIFSAEPVPQANLEHAWQRLRGGLPTLARQPRRAPFWRWTAWRWLAVPLVAGLAMLAFVVVQHHPLTPAHGAGANPETAANLAAGPLTSSPRDPELAAHLERAERLLTEVSHSPGPLDQATLRQAEELRLSNALYVRKANAEGDLADAQVLDHLDRTLIALQHEPAPTGEAEREGKGWHLRAEVNTNGLLLDIRILQQNDNLPKEAQ